MKKISFFLIFLQNKLNKVQYLLATLVFTPFVLNFYCWSDKFGCVIYLVIRTFKDTLTNEFRSFAATSR
ncbi:hypothetical protein CIK86_18265 [Pseudoalteromonas sp. JB197]|nr:hypothetical protein CIK86_18265 [Pseudoalteromonas sp. JB197]